MCREVQYLSTLFRQQDAHNDQTACDSGALGHEDAIDEEEWFAAQGWGNSFKCCNLMECYSEFWRSGHRPQACTKCMVVNTDNGTGFHWFMVFLETHTGVGLAPMQASQQTVVGHRGVGGHPFKHHRSPTHDHMEDVQRHDSNRVKKNLLGDFGN